MFLHPWYLAMVSYGLVIEQLPSKIDWQVSLWRTPSQLLGNDALGSNEVDLNTELFGLKYFFQTALLGIPG